MKRFLENLTALVVAFIGLTWTMLPFTGAFRGRPWLIAAWLVVMLVALAGAKTRVEIKWGRR